MTHTISIRSTHPFISAFENSIRQQIKPPFKHEGSSKYGEGKRRCPAKNATVNCLRKAHSSIYDLKNTRFENKFQFPELSHLPYQQ